MRQITHAYADTLEETKRRLEQAIRDINEILNGLDGDTASRIDTLGFIQSELDECENAIIEMEWVQQ